MVGAEQERELAVAWHVHGDEEALRRLVGSHLRLVIKTARGYGGYGLPVLELISEGNVGLMQAPKKLDPERESGRGSCRERVCMIVLTTEVAITFKKKKK